MKIEKLIISELKNYSQDNNFCDTTPLFGNEGLLDSMGLVNLIVTLEERIQEEYEILITIADEKAMSRSESPFRNVSTLAEYIEELLIDEKAHV